MSEIIILVNPEKRQFMKWSNASSGQLPPHGQTVIVSVNGVYHTAIFDAKEKIFTSTGDKQVIFNPADVIVYWTELGNAPPPDQKS